MVDTPQAGSANHGAEKMVDTQAASANHGAENFCASPDLIWDRDPVPLYELLGAIETYRELQAREQVREGISPSGARAVSATTDESGIQHRTELSLTRVFIEDRARIEKAKEDVLLATNELIKEAEHLRKHLPQLIRAWTENLEGLTQGLKKLKQDVEAGEELKDGCSAFLAPERVASLPWFSAEMSWGDMTVDGIKTDDYVVAFFPDAEDGECFRVVDESCG
ncbi:hypothetical protein MFIFM68171_09531 [Madurella fahalii]|uniref:Uncharacterized protein n=1 Tax=Madurella fahalii TaxID=1157608 RepID=A0ABQ0GNH6_9PEZI